MTIWRSGLILIVPAIALEIAILFLPLTYVFFRSFYDWQPAGVSTPVGFENYAILLLDPAFWQVVWNQMIYLLGVPIWVLAPLVVAYVLRDGVWMAGVFRMIYFLPAVMSPAIVGLVFRSLLATDGPVNAALEGVGLGLLAQPWLTDAALVKPVVIIMVLWAGFGIGVLVFGSAFDAIPKDILEAARLDGARFWQEFFLIAVPQIWQTVVLWTMFQIVAIFLFMFGWIFVLTGGGPGQSSATMDFSIYQQFMRFGFYGTAAAQTVVLVLMIVAIPMLALGAMALLRLVERLRDRRGRPSGPEAAA
jgi:ABC-type sugar transport system permease subunit